VRWKKGNKKDWEIEVDRILKEGSFNAHMQAFLEKFREPSKQGRSGRSIRMSYYPIKKEE